MYLQIIFAFPHHKQTFPQTVTNYSLILEDNIMDFRHLFPKFELISFIYGAEFKNGVAIPPLPHMSSWHSD
jgi:hypothetical protein